MNLPGNTVQLEDDLSSNARYETCILQCDREDDIGPVDLLKTYCHERKGLCNPSLRHASIFTGKMGYIFSILKLFLSEITNLQDFIQEYVLVWCLKNLFMLDKRPAACQSAEMNGTIMP